MLECRTQQQLLGIAFIAPLDLAEHGVYDGKYAVPIRASALKLEPISIERTPKAVDI